MKSEELRVQHGGIDVLIVITGWSPETPSTQRRDQAFQALATAAIRYEIPLVITSPRRLLARKRFAGWGCTTSEGRVVWNHSVWTLARDAVVYDAMYLRDLKIYRNAYKRLRVQLDKQRIPVFNPVLPAKNELYRILTKRPIRGGRLPMTVTRISPRGALRLLDKTSKLWLKPVYGSGGRNIAYIERRPNQKYMVVAERHRNRSINEEMGKQRLLQFTRQLTRYREYMAQEHVELLTTADGRKVDFRVTVQRHDNGAWGVTATTLRMGAAGSVLTNYHAGGIVRSLTNLSSSQRTAYMEALGIEPPDLRKMNRFALRIARRLQSHYPSLAILGLDIGQTADGEFFVYDFNGRPGRDILTDDEVVQFMDAIAGYAHYLSNLGNRR